MAIRLAITIRGVVMEKLRRTIFVPVAVLEWGNEDYTSESRTEYRNKWLADGAKWFEPQEKPVNWNLEEQLKNIDHETDG